MITDSMLAKDIMNIISLKRSRDYVDPWRLYQSLPTYDRACKNCVEQLDTDQLDIVAAVSDLGLPLAMSIGYELYLQKSFNGPIILLDYQEESGWIRPDNDISKKGILLCDDILAGGSHMLDCIKKLTDLKANVIGAIVLLDSNSFPFRDPANDVFKLLGDNFLALTDSTYLSGVLV